MYEVVIEDGANGVMLVLYDSPEYADSGFEAKRIGFERGEEVVLGLGDIEQTVLIVVTGRGSIGAW